MTIEDIRAFRNAQPFTPFEIVMEDGRVFPIRAPYRIALSPSGRTFATFVAGAATLPFVTEIAQVRPIPVSADSKSGNQ